MERAKAKPRTQSVALRRTGSGKLIIRIRSSESTKGFAIPKKIRAERSHPRKGKAFSEGATACWGIYLEADSVLSGNCKVTFDRSISLIVFDPSWVERMVIAGLFALC